MYYGIIIHPVIIILYKTFNTWRIDICGYFTDI